MKFLIIGLGSMGKRRIRNLRALGYYEVTGYDVREDRRKEAEDSYGIAVISDLNTISQYDAVVISTSPDTHNAYMRTCIESGKPCFVELSILVQDLPELDALARTSGSLVAPSCTFMFHPSVRLIKETVVSGKYGKVTSFTHYSGQYLPDWHPWERIGDFFVSKKETSGCKEILSFELHWMTGILGVPQNVFACSGNAMEFVPELDDVYAVCLGFKNCVGILLADVVSRFASRSLIMNMERAQIRWNWEEKKVRLYDAEHRSWSEYRDPECRAHEGYNVNIIENMYIDEIRAFIDAVEGKGTFPNTLGDDIEVLRVIEKIEQARLGEIAKECK